MKTRFYPGRRPGHSQSGSAVLILLVLLGIMLVFVAINTDNLNWLRRQMKLVDQRQTQRLARSAAAPPVSR